MAFTYLVVNLIFIVCIVVLFSQHLQKPNKNWVIALIALLVLTAVFDSLIVWANIVGYDPAKILGLYIGHAPIEDFFYAILAIIIVPALWNLFGKRLKSK